MAVPNINPSQRAFKNYPADDRWMIWADGVFRPYENVNEVNTTIPVARRHQGLFVNILNILWWYKDGTADENLVPFGGEEVDRYTEAANFSYAIPAQTMVDKIVIKPDNAITVKIGTAADSDDVLFEVTIAGGDYYGVTKDIFSGTLYFTGITTSTEITVYKRKL